MHTSDLLQFYLNFCVLFSLHKHTDTPKDTHTRTYTPTYTQTQSCDAPTQTLICTWKNAAIPSKKPHMITPTHTHMETQTRTYRLRNTRADPHRHGHTKTNTDTTVHTHTHSQVFTEATQTQKKTQSYPHKTSTCILEHARTVQRSLISH